MQDRFREWNQNVGGIPLDRYRFAIAGSEAGRIDMDLTLGIGNSMLQSARVVIAILWWRIGFIDRYSYPFITIYHEVVTWLEA